jgi:hypothetical protein
MAKRPFLEDGSQFGISRTDSRRMRKEQKREAMVEWFHQNFEDPAQRTSYVSAEGGYLWNHGGPYDASEQLYDMFGDLVSEKLIEEVVEEVEADGLSEWAPVNDPYQDDDERELHALETLDDFSDERSPTYGSPADLAARERVRNVLDELQKALDQSPPIGIGHNKPPESIDNEQIKEVRVATIQLTIQFKSPEPSIPEVKSWGKTIWKVLAAGGAAIGLGMLSGVGKKIGEDHLANPVIHLMQVAYNEIFHWLQIVAHLLQ